MKGLLILSLVASLVAAQVPAGVVLPYAATSAPAGYLLCDGVAHEQATYPTLFAVIGTSFGGNSTFFNTPDMRGRVVGGQGAGVFAVPIASVVGAAEHTLTVAELAPHTHASGGATTSAGVHDHGGKTRTENTVHTHWINMYASPVPCSSGNAQWAGMSDVCGDGNKAIGLVSSQVEESLHNHTIYADGAHVHQAPDTASAGLGTPFSVVQPTLVMQYIIKT